MVIYKKALVNNDQKLTRPNSSTEGELKKVTIRVALDENGNLCAADMDQGLFNGGSDDEERMRTAIEAVESYLNLPHGRLSISSKRPEAYLN